MRSLTTYTIADLRDLITQGYAQLPHLTVGDQHDMIDLIARIDDEIDARLTGLAARVCGYAEDGSLLPAVENHRFQHIARSRR